LNIIEETHLLPFESSQRWKIFVPLCFISRSWKRSAYFRNARWNLQSP